MKLQLLYDTNYASSDAMNTDAEDDDDGGYCSDHYINSRHPHECLSYHEALYQQVNKYFRNVSKTSGKTLIDVPDEIMLQYMLEGVYDNDYLAYDFYEHRLCISNEARGALRYGEESRYGHAVSRWVNNSQNSLFFKFDISTLSPYDVQNNTREDYMIVPDGEHYRNIIEAIEPYVQYKFVEFFKMGAEMIYSTQRFDGNRPSHGDEEIWYEDMNLDTLTRVRRVFKDDEVGCRNTWDMRYDAFVMCLQFWETDHKIFVDTSKYFSDYEIEAYRLMDNRIKNKISGTTI